MYMKEVTKKNIKDAKLVYIYNRQLQCENVVQSLIYMKPSVHSNWVAHLC